MNATLGAALRRTSAVLDGDMRNSGSRAALRELAWPHGSAEVSGVARASYFAALALTADNMSLPGSKGERTDCTR